MHGYPRPQLRRAEWLSLNGPWAFAIDFAGRVTRPEDLEWTHTIIVPFAPEAPASGIGRSDLFQACWYRRTVELDPVVNGQRLLLHFGAVDYTATIWVNDCQVFEHDGGYTPFTVDITDICAGRTTAVIVVRAQDDPADLAKPRGKQDWEHHPHSIWYPRTSGIWQTVWIERVPAIHVSRIRWTPNLERWEIGCAVWMDGEEPDEELFLTVRLSVGGVNIANDRYLVVNREVHRRIAPSDPGIDDYRNELLWSPHRPTLIEADLTLVTASGVVIDHVQSYTALRSIATDGERIVLNGRPYYLKMVLDQGYWDATGLTAPDDDALRADVMLAKAMGFDGVRKHQKIEDPRYLYWADRLGLLVWAEMPSCYRFTEGSIRRATQEWMDVLLRDFSHPCIIAWVPFNESWGVPNLPMNPAERHYVHSMYHLTKTLDSTRPVIGNDGWESVSTDIIGIHDYDADPEGLAQRYRQIVRRRLFKHERPGGRALVLSGEPNDQPVMLTEFGGITVSNVEGTWGYSRAEDTEQFGERYTMLIAAVRSVGLFAGFCYTQFADTYQETNGLLYADRTPKFPLEHIAHANATAQRDWG